MYKLFTGHTVLLIAHRLSTVEKANRIIVIDGGRVVQEGTHKELLNQDGLYKSLVQRQLLGRQTVKIFELALCFLWKYFQVKTIEAQPHLLLNQLRKEYLNFIAFNADMFSYFVLKIIYRTNCTSTLFQLSLIKIPFDQLHTTKLDLTTVKRRSIEGYAGRKCHCLSTAVNSIKLSFFFFVYY